MKPNSKRQSQISNEDALINRYKVFGYTVYKCKDCGRRAFGVGKNNHESAYPTHTMIAEDSND